MAIWGQSPPYEAYAAILGAFAGGLALVGGLARLLDRDPREHRSTQVLAPRFGRLLTWTVGTAALNDFLQAGFAALTAKANELESRGA